ncbi:MAG: tetratricopeptide repeat protein [Acidobacteria bacterium]|nr:tetratricopeptide repeat protein [Acidobacteriota bacterium]MBI3428102.1 tetratricopeptide repeat protein [Acidobacteriota bacterium]
MKLKATLPVLSASGLVLMFFAFQLLLVVGAQDIGHLGVNDDPAPLFQAKRIRKFIARNNIRKNDTLIADVSTMAGTAMRPAPRPNVVAAATPTPSVLPNTAAASNTALIAAPVNMAGALPTNAPTLAKISPYEEAMARADIAASMGKQSAAIEAYRQALNLEPNAPDALLGLADALHDAKDYAQADKEYQQLIAQQPNSIEARRGHADVLYELKRWDEAIAEYQAAIKAGATDAGIYNNYGNALFRTGDRAKREQAIVQYRVAVQKDPKFGEAHAGLANALRTAKQLTEAQQLAEQAVQLAPESAVAHSILGRVYADLKDFPRATAEGEKAVQLSPSDAFMHVNLGGIYSLQGRLDDALRSYLRACSYDKQWAFPHNSLGNLFMKMNRPPEAIEEFTSAANLEPRSSTIQNNLGTALATQRKWNEAIGHFQQAAQFDPRNTTAFSNLGSAFVAQQRYTEAIEAFKRASEIEPQNTSYKLALADTYKLAGNAKEAKLLYQELEKLGVSTKQEQEKKKKKK